MTPDALLFGFLSMAIPHEPLAIRRQSKKGQHSRAAPGWPLLWRQGRPLLRPGMVNHRQYIMNCTRKAGLLCFLNTYQYLCGNDLQWFGWFWVIVIMMLSYWWCILLYRILSIPFGCYDCYYIPGNVRRPLWSNKKTIIARFYGFKVH